MHFTALPELFRACFILRSLRKSLTKAKEQHATDRVVINYRFTVLGTVFFLVVRTYTKRTFSFACGWHRHELECGQCARLTVVVACIGPPLFFLFASWVALVPSYESLEAPVRSSCPKKVRSKMKKSGRFLELRLRPCQYPDSSPITPHVSA